MEPNLDEIHARNLAYWQQQVQQEREWAEIHRQCRKAVQRAARRQQPITCLTCSTILTNPAEVFCSRHMPEGGL